MGYTLTTAQKAPFLDGNGNAIPTADISDTGGLLPPFIGPIGAVQDDGAGNLEFVAGGAGSVVLTLKHIPTGQVVTHTVTVTDVPPPPPTAPFDWTLGTPVDK